MKRESELYDSTLLFIIEDQLKSQRSILVKHLQAINPNPSLDQAVTARDCAQLLSDTCLILEDSPLWKSRAEYESCHVAGLDKCLQKYADFIKEVELKSK